MTRDPTRHEALKVTGSNACRVVWVTNPWTFARTADSALRMAAINSARWSCGSRSRPASGSRPRCSRSRANASAGSRPSVRRSDDAPAGGAAGGAPCSPGPDAASRCAAENGGTSARSGRICRTPGRGRAGFDRLERRARPYTRRVAPRDRACRDHAARALPRSASAGRRAHALAGTRDVPPLTARSTAMPGLAIPRAVQIPGAVG